MTEGEYEFEVSVFIKGKHIVTYRDTTEDFWDAMRGSYLLTANLVSLISELTAKAINPFIDDNGIWVYCTQNVMECCAQMRKAGWFITDPLRYVQIGP